MTDDLRQEFYGLQQRAKQELRDLRAPKGYRSVFTIFTWPSFTPSFRWSVYVEWTPVVAESLERPGAALRSGTPKRGLAMYSVWRSDLDLEKLRTPLERLKYPKILAPTIEEETMELNGGDIEGFGQCIRGISVPLLLGSPQMIGCDGTSYEFRSENGFSESCLRWWEDGPSEWRPFTGVIRKIVQELEERRMGTAKQARG